MIFLSEIKIARMFLRLIIREVFKSTEQLICGALSRHFGSFWCPDSHVKAVRAWMLEDSREYSCILVYVSRAKFLAVFLCTFYDLQNS